MADLQRENGPLPDRQGAHPDLGKKLARDLCMSLCPACLLRPPRRRRLRQFARDFEVRDHGEAPAFERAAYAEVEVFGQRVTRPAAGVIDRRPAPHPCRSVEGERQPARKRASCSIGEMAVEQEALRARQPVALAIVVTPAGLNEGEALIGHQGRDRALQEIGSGNEIRIENRDIGRLRMLRARRRDSRP